MKQTIIRYVISSLITWFSGFVGFVVLLLGTMPVEEIPLTGAFWTGILLVGIRLAIKTFFEGLPKLFEEIKTYYKK